MAQRAWCLVKLERADEAIVLYEQALASERRSSGDTAWSVILADQLDWARQKRIQ
jgi:hypothetical protein